MSPGKRDASSKRDTGNDDRPPIRRTPSFDKALSRLGVQDRARVIVGLEEFEKDWRSGRPIDEVRKQWDYKSPKVTAGCKAYGLRQMRPTNTTRAWLAPDARSGNLLVLFVIRKTSSPEQQRIINWLCKRLAASRS